MSWMDFDDVRKRRGITAQNLADAGGAMVDGAQAASDARRGIRSDKQLKNKGNKNAIKILGANTKPLSPSDVRKLEGIARKRENGKALERADEKYLKKMGFKVPKSK